jgi:hypothetical protein
LKLVSIVSTFGADNPQKHLHVVFPVWRAPVSTATGSTRNASRTWRANQRDLISLML